MAKWLAGAALLLAGCSYTIPAEHAAAPKVDLSADAAVVVGSLDEIERELESTSSEDLEMAWQDLNEDLRSLVADVVDRPGSVDIAGVQTRVEGFVTRFGSAEEMSGVVGHWDRLIASLGSMANRTELASRLGSS